MPSFKESDPSSPSIPTPDTSQVPLLPSYSSPPAEKSKITPRPATKKKSAKSKAAVIPGHCPLNKELGDKITGSLALEKYEVQSMSFSVSRSPASRIFELFLTSIVDGDGCPILQVVLRARRCSNHTRWLVSQSLLPIHDTEMHSI